MKEAMTMTDIYGSEASRYELLAEELVELAHKSLKMARIIRGEQPTDARSGEVYQEWHDELADVFTVLDTLDKDREYLEARIEEKTRRWFERMKGGET